MIYRRFGKTGLQMPVLSAGFMRAMHSWQNIPAGAIPAASQENVEAIVHRAMDLGINHFETARGYGTSEIQLGLALHHLPRESFLVQTKVPPAENPMEFRKNVENSLSRLGLDRVDLLAIHGVNDYRSLWRVCRRGGCLHMARRLQREGLAGSIGFSGHGPLDVILQALRHEDDGGFDYLNIHWYYIQQGNSPALEEAATRDMGIFIISPTDKGGMLQNPPEKLQRLCRPLSPIRFNDLYCLSRPEIHTISVGAVCPEDFDEHSAALELLGTCRELTAVIDRRLQAAMETETGFAHPGEAGSRLPSWEDTPGYINTRYILWLLDLARGWNLIEFGKRQYRKLGLEVRWVPGNNAAEAARFDFSSLAAKAGMKTGDLMKMLQEAHDQFSTGNM
ncbi:MAG: aldo/keto reductase [Desulfobulbaceae bacterium]|nr:aldo/keto reductase [Desulfobulbaceae bacterium]